MGACVAGGVCMAGCMCGRVYVWQGACMAGGLWGGGGHHAWQEACVAGEKATAADSVHPTGMHSCVL